MTHGLASSTIRHSPSAGTSPLSRELILHTTSRCLHLHGLNMLGHDEPAVLAAVHRYVNTTHHVTASPPMKTPATLSTAEKNMYVLPTSS